MTKRNTRICDLLYYHLEKETTPGRQLPVGTTNAATVANDG